MVDAALNTANHSNLWLERICANKFDLENVKLDGLSRDQAWLKVQTQLGLDDFDFAQAIAEEFGLELAKLPGKIDQAVFHYVPFSVASRYQVFPIDIQTDRVVVATAHPMDDEMLSVLGFLSALFVEPRIAPPGLINQWIKEHYDQTWETDEDITIKLRQTGQASRSTHVGSDDSAIVEIVSDMLLEAFAMNASDIHIEPYKDGGVIRYRIDGILHVITELPTPVLVPIIQRIKAISSLNLANKMIPQDGSVSLVMRGHSVDLRVSTIPVKGGEKAVIRLLVPSSVGNIDHIGLPEPEKEKFKQLLAHSSGIFIITGPTGSGKSTTLYSALKELNTFDRCLVTVEDPIEYEIDGIAQINVNPAQDVTFNTSLRSILRQDPDVILVGEVRDEESAEITFRAAVTGHFVMTTLHTNDAISTIPRLIGLGLPSTIIADSLRGVAAQRLVRKLCTHCLAEGIDENDLVSKRFQDIYPDKTLYSAIGCKQCNQTGYKGRMPLFEIVTIDSALADAIRDNRSTEELRRCAIERGSRPMSTIATEAILSGKTTVQEVHRVLGEKFWESATV